MQTLMLAALMLSLAAAVSSAGTCTASSYNGTHVMVCPHPPGAKHELVCHNKNLGRPSGAIVLNGELFRKDFPCELWRDCYVIPKNTCPNGHSIIHKTNGFLNPARCTDLPDAVSSTFPTLPPEPHSIIMEVIAEDTRRSFTRLALITAGIFVVILAMGIVLYKCRKSKTQSKRGDPEAPNRHQVQLAPQVTGNSYREIPGSASIPLCNGTGHAPCNKETEEQHGGSADVNEEEALTGPEQTETCIA